LAQAPPRGPLLLRLTTSLLIRFTILSTGSIDTSRNTHPPSYAFLLQFSSRKLTEAVLDAWITGGDDTEPTHEVLVGRLGTVAMVATAKGADGMKATWVRCLGLPSFKIVVTLAENGTNGMVIMNLPEKIPSLGACAACVAAKAVHLSHEEGYERKGTGAR